MKTDNVYFGILALVAVVAVVGLLSSSMSFTTNQANIAGEALTTGASSTSGISQTASSTTIESSSKPSISSSSSSTSLGGGIPEPDGNCQGFVDCEALADDERGCRESGCTWLGNTHKPNCVARYGPVSCNDFDPEQCEATPGCTLCECGGTSGNEVPYQTRSCANQGFLGVCGDLEQSRTCDGCYWSDWGPDCNSVANEESCDYLDNDCDGQVDEGFEPKTGETCFGGVGVCYGPGTTICSEDGRETVCNLAPVLSMGAESCNNLDDDCDGFVDEDFALELGQKCNVGIGECQDAGYYICSEKGTGVICNVEPGQPELEICDGLDNDCNGLVDDHLQSILEECNGLDDNCDGRIDEGFENIVEECNGLDDNCDGDVDEWACPEQARWETGSWINHCESSGQKTRYVVCEDANGYGYDDSVCLQYDGPKPADAMDCYEWVPREWSPCTTENGYSGTQERVVRCRNLRTQSFVEDQFCSGMSKPATSQGCTSCSVKHWDGISLEWYSPEDDEWIWMPMPDMTACVDQDCEGSIALQYDICKSTKDSQQLRKLNSCCVDAGLPKPEPEVRDCAESAACGGNNYGGGFGNGGGSGSEIPTCSGVDGCNHYCCTGYWFSPTGCNSPECAALMSCEFNYAICSNAGCFVAGIPVTLADGSTKSIEQVSFGEQLLDMNGDVVVVEEVFHIPFTGKIFSFNGGDYFVTETHAFKTPNGWKALDPQGAMDENPGLEVTQLSVGDTLFRDDGSLFELESLEYKESSEMVYNFRVSGTNTYIADGFVVHNAQTKN